MSKRFAVTKSCALVVVVACASLAMAQPAPSGAPPPPGPAPLQAATPSTSIPSDSGQGDPAAMLREILPPLPPDAPKPSPEPRNLEGTWIHDQPLTFRNEVDMYGNKLPYTEKGKRIVDDRVKATYKNGSPYANASAACLPPGQQWQYDLNMPFQTYQSTNDIAIVFQEYHGIWNIRMNQQPHRDSAVAPYMGDSVGHWDGDTLVVDSTNYKWPTWVDVDGTPASKHAHWTHRIRRIDYGSPKLEIVSTLIDPELYTSPVSYVRTFAWRPDKLIFQEYNCEYQVGSPGGVSRYGLVPEPKENLR